MYLSVCVHAHAQTKRSTDLKFGIQLPKRVFEKSFKRFFSKLMLVFFKIFLCIFFLGYLQAILSFHDIFWMNASIFFLLERFSYHLCTIVNFIAMRHLKVLPFCWNIYLGYKSGNNWSVFTKIGYVFAVSNISLYTKNCDGILNAF